MDRIPLYTDVNNLIEIFSLDRMSSLFQGMKQFISNESEIIFCEKEEDALLNPLFSEVAKEFSSNNYIFKYRSEEENFLTPPFKTNLQDRFENKSSILFSDDTARIELSMPKNGILMADSGNERIVYDKLNFSKEFFRANRILTIGKEFTTYNSFEEFILPFSEIIINEPYLFVPERKDFTLKSYLENNFESLFKVLFKNISNKVNIIICSFVNEQFKQESHWYDRASNSFNPLYEYIKDFLNGILGGARYNLWLVISPMARQARHDRYVLTNYQYIESGAGLTYFDHRGNFINRGEGVHLYSIMHDDARKSLIPSVIHRIQTDVINSVKATNPERIFGIEQGNSYYLNFA
jgi:hypothetical protein